MIAGRRMEEKDRANVVPAFKGSVMLHHFFSTSCSLSSPETIHPLFTR